VLLWLLNELRAAIFFALHVFVFFVFALPQPDEKALTSLHKPLKELCGACSFID
jgi:hypothetical protein